MKKKRLKDAASEVVDAMPARDELTKGQSL